MAFIIVFALIMLVIKTKDFTYIIFLAVYGIDTVLTICHRLLLRENLGVAHRKHAYQLMANELSISHVKVSLIYAILQLLISLGLIFLPINHLLYSIIVLMTLSGTYILFMKKYYHLHDEYLRTLKTNPYSLFMNSLKILSTGILPNKHSRIFASFCLIA